MGGGARYDYPKYVWSPAGGWWTRPANWRANTAITFSGIFGICYFAWTASSKLEQRTQPPSRPLPSQLWQNEVAQKVKANTPEL